MPELSQRTLAKVIAALGEMVPQDEYVQHRDFWRTKLFEWGFPEWLRIYVQNCGLNWTVIIPALYEGNGVKDKSYQIPHLICHEMLRKLTVMAYEEGHEFSQESIRLSLQLDGFEVHNSDLQRIDGPVSVDQEKSRLIAQLRSSKLARQDVISKHLRDAEDLFATGKNHPAIGQARNALQAVIEETVHLRESKCGKRSGSGIKNEIDFLEEEGILSEDEQKAFLAAWGFLCSGNHPGMSNEEAGRIGVILCLEFIQILLVKCGSVV